LVDELLSTLQELNVGYCNQVFKGAATENQNQNQFEIWVFVGGWMDGWMDGWMYHRV
jgi:hypothetical protein